LAWLGLAWAGLSWLGLACFINNVLSYFVKICMDFSVHFHG
jgi:hypothetical protein